jgi:hypothetical protein
MNELEKTWTKSVVAYFKAQFNRPIGRTEENHGNLGQDNRYLC